MDDVDAELARLGLWALFAAAAQTAGVGARDAAEEADDLLAEAAHRFPAIAPAPVEDPTGGLGPA